MRKLAKVFFSLAMMGLFIGAPFSWSAAKNDWPMEAFEPDLTNLPSLQNGFKVYANHCLGCHSLQYQRYGRTADDLGIPRELALESVVFTGQKIGELITTSMFAFVIFRCPSGHKQQKTVRLCAITMLTAIRDNTKPRTSPPGG